MKQIIKRMAAVILITLFVSGFFFLDEGRKKPASGEKETVVADQEGIMAVRLVHNATAFKLAQLQQEQQPIDEKQEELSAYLEGELLQYGLDWLQTNENVEIEYFLHIDTSVSPVVVDEVGDQITLIWGSPRKEETEITYQKINDVWKAVEMTMPIGSE